MKIFKKKLVDMTVKDAIKLYFLWLTWVSVDRVVARELKPVVDRFTEKLKG
jgi:hypothetical protein